MIEVSIFIPVASNDKKRTKRAHFAEFEQDLLDLFGGFTTFPGELAGAWLGGDTRFDDILVVYVVAIHSITEGGKVALAAKIANAHFAQEAVYIRYLGLSEIVTR